MRYITEKVIEVELFAKENKAPAGTRTVELRRPVHPSRCFNHSATECPKIIFTFLFSIYFFVLVLYIQECHPLAIIVILF